MILPEGRNESVLKRNLIKWVSTNPRLDILGEQLEVEETCLITLSDMGDGECSKTPNDNASHQDFRLLGLLSLLVLVVLVLSSVVLWCKQEQYKGYCCKR